MLGMIIIFILLKLIINMVIYSRDKKQNDIAIKNNYRCPHCYTLTRVQGSGVLVCGYCRRPMILRDNKLVRLDNVKCPYCHRHHDLEDGYYKCKCGKNFRKIKDGTSFKVFKEDETINDLMILLLDILNQVLNQGKEVNQAKIDFFKELIVEAFSLNENQIKWCIEYGYIPEKPYTYYSDFRTEYISREIDWFMRDAPNFLNNTEIKDISKLLLELILNLIYFDKKENKEFENEEYLIYSSLGISKEYYNELKKEVIGRIYGANNSFINESDLDKYYQILNIDKNSSNTDIKKAYRKLMNLYHPDKHIHKNLSSKEMEEMNKKLLEVQHAYESIIKYKDAI